MSNCRCCGAELPSRPLITLNNMPKSAQNFPTKETLAEDSGVDLNLFQCVCCGTIQLSGEPVPYYRDVIRAVGVSSDMKNFRSSQFKSWVERNNLVGKKILEVGCGTGDFLEIMDKTGAVAYGLENAANSVEVARAKGLKILQGFIEDEDIKLNHAPFDAFYILNFLEHIPNPRAFLRGISANLKDDAVGLVEVPNSDMILRENLYSELIQDHLLYFTEDTLTRLLESNEFEVLSCRVIWNEYILSAEVKKRRETDLDGFLTNRNMLRYAVDSFFQKMESHGIKVAIWGAGHQALANISLLNMREHATCVLDSAKFKQGKYTPATHLPILAPDVLDKKEIGAVLIMAGSYSQEIKNFLQEKYPDVICAVMTTRGLERELVKEDAIIDRLYEGTSDVAKATLGGCQVITLWQTLRDAVDSFFKKMESHGIKVAIWGAGHQALANISLLNMKDHVTCVLDSAKFKQGKYTPATHLPILAPDVLAEKNIGAVLIIAGNYSQEIKSFLQEKYPDVICAVMARKGLERDYEREDSIIVALR